VSRRAHRTLPRRFYARPTLEVAEDLLGKVLVHDTPEGQASGIIVETEAYIGEDDPACHAAAGPTARNRPLYGPPGFAYVYFTYGMHYLVNAVTEPAGVPAAVLIRALEPLDGIEEMVARSRAGRPGRRPLPTHALCRGPARLTRALAIGPGQNESDLISSPLRIEHRGFARSPAVWGIRIGIRHATDRPWRCFVEGHPSVSPWRGAANRRLGGRASSGAREP
jgi:DNA-3-methyladenine glycosylase